MRVLLVEDDAMIAQGLQTALRQTGFAVDWMRDGRSGAEALKTTAFDVILLDLGLPHRDGRGATAQSSGTGCTFLGTG